MKRINRLVKANPVPGGAEPPEDLFRLITNTGSAPEARATRRFRHHAIRGLLAALAVLVVGSGVAWATGGIDPVERLERIWGIDRDAGFSVDKTGYGLQEFSVLEPMTHEKFDEMPDRLKFTLATVRTRPSLIPDDSVDGGFRRKWIQLPRQVAGWGKTTTAGGNGVPPEDVAVVSMNGRVCFFWGGYEGGSCGSVGEISGKGLSTSVNGFPAGTRWAIGLVTDQVASLWIDYPGYGEVPVKDNIFQATDIPDERFFLIGRDDEGSIVTRILVGSR